MKPLQIDVVSDVVCPWCYVGMRRMNQALDLYRQKHPKEPDAEIRWHPFQLNPDLNPEGMARADYVKQKFGDRSGDVYARVKAVGLSVGIDFNFDGIARQPNTLIPHALIGVAEPGAEQNRLVQALFEAYFIQNLDLTRAESLAQVARQAGIDEARITEALSDRGLHAQVAQADGQARAMGVTGVPFFIFNGEFAISGAHEPENLLQAMEQACEEAE